MPPLGGGGRLFRIGVHVHQEEKSSAHERLYETPEKLRVTNSTEYQKREE
jgi:hypothetical protein